MISISALKDQQGYHGKCRNASIAVWYAEAKRFVYVRSKFTSAFFETIQHLEDPTLDASTDGFAPEREATRDEVLLSIGKTYKWVMDEYVAQRAEDEAERAERKRHEEGSRANQQLDP